MEYLTIRQELVPYAKRMYDEDLVFAMNHASTLKETEACLMADHGVAASECLLKLHCSEEGI